MVPLKNLRIKSRAQCGYIKRGKRTTPGPAKTILGQLSGEHARRWLARAVARKSIGLTFVRTMLRCSLGQ